MVMNVRVVVRRALVVREALVVRPTLVLSFHRQHYPDTIQVHFVLIVILYYAIPLQNPPPKKIIIWFISYDSWVDAACFMPRFGRAPQIWPRYHFQDAVWMADDRLWLIPPILLHDIFQWVIMNESFAGEWSGFLAFEPGLRWNKVRTESLLAYSNLIQELHFKYFLINFILRFYRRF